MADVESTSPFVPRQPSLTDPAASDIAVDPAELAAIENDLAAVESTVAEIDRILAEHADEPERAAAAIEALGRQLGTPS